MGKRAQNFSKLLCDKISFKTRQRYTDVVNSYRCRLSFLIGKMVLLCIRGSRKTRCNKIESNIDENDFEYGCFESKLWFESPMDSPFFMLRYLIRSLHIVSTTLYISYLYFKKNFCLSRSQISLVTSSFHVRFCLSMLRVIERELLVPALSLVLRVDNPGVQYNSMSWE